MKKIVLIRLDKIGDLICTLPTDQVLDQSAYDVTWVVQKGMGNIVNFGEKKRRFIELDKSKPEESRQIFADFLKQNDFDYAVSFQCPWWINYELFKARIRHRIGVLSQWHSFLFLNEGVRQKRSRAIKHEFEYNLELVEKITGPLTQNPKEIYFKFKKPQSTATLEKFGLSPNYIVVHPGMMGSALNWPQQKYIEYIDKQIKLNRLIVITGTDADEPYLDQIKKVYLNHPQVKWLQSKLNFSELLEILNYSEKIIAPSTGVAHIAASLDKEVHAIFSHIRVHHPIRWSPRGKNIHIYLPKVANPETCDHADCMTKIELP
ncbi:glycosyltransferase family 9 protein [Pseudobdellovibrio sp. HCB154]|uniref:glycosyltransferase family 9 protein n=1 Tax=Pseudobdellovibrio sp. HCB154 TaxID=3386277 RepID=UPI0039171C59